MPATTTVDPESLPTSLEPVAAMTWFHENRMAKLKADLEAVFDATVVVSPQNLEYPYTTHVKVTWAGLPGAVFEFFVKPEFTSFHGGGHSSCKRIVWVQGGWRCRTFKVGKTFSAILHKALEVRTSAVVDDLRANASLTLGDHAIKVLNKLGYMATLDNGRAGEVPKAGTAWVRPQVGVNLDGKGGATVLPANAQASVVASVTSELMGFPVKVILEGSIGAGKDDFVVDTIKCGEAIAFGLGQAKLVNPRPWK